MKFWLPEVRSGSRVRVMILTGLGAMTLSWTARADERAPTNAELTVEPSPAAAPDVEVAGDRANGGSRRDAVDEKKSEVDEDENEHFRIGPLVGVGFPHPLAIEGMIKVERVFALGFEYAVLPTTTLGGVETRSWSVAGDARFFPFKNAFFIGFRAGHQRMTASTTLSLSGVGSIDESAVAETSFINPRLGVLFTSHSGLTIGIDAGVQVPINPSFKSTLPTAVAQIDKTVSSVADAFGNGVTPTVDLLRVGFLF